MGAKQRKINRPGRPQHFVVIDSLRTHQLAQFFSLFLHSSFFWLVKMYYSLPITSALVSLLASVVYGSPVTVDLPDLPASPINLSDILANVKTSPVKGKRSPLDLSILGGLIPAIPGVTEPLNGIIPPLPVLQAPLPPLESDPFTPSNIKPKKIGYFWTGAGDNQHKDFLVTASLDDVRSEFSIRLLTVS